MTRDVWDFMRPGRSFWSRVCFESSGGDGDSGGGDDDTPQKSSADVQKEINAALKASGGAWTSELNTLVAERDAAKAAEASGGGGTTTTTSVSAAADSGDDRQEKLLGSVSPQGTYAGDGFQWKENEGGYLTRVYTGANENLGLGMDPISAGASDKGMKETIAQLSLDEGSPYAETKASATDTSFWSLITTGDPGGSASYAEQVGASPAVAGPTGTDFTYAGSFNEAFKDARSTLGPGQTFTYGGKEYSTATAEERPDLAGPPATGIGSLASYTDRLADVGQMTGLEAMEPGFLGVAPSAESVAKAAEYGASDLTRPIDYTVTASGRPYGQPGGMDGSSGIYVSGAEAALGPDTGILYGDIPDYFGSYGADLGVTPGYSFNPATGQVEPNPVVDLGEINIAPEPDYSYDPYGAAIQSWIDESKPLSTDDSIVGLGIARVPQIVYGGLASLGDYFSRSGIGADVSPEGEVTAYYKAAEPSAASQYLREQAAESRAVEEQILSQMRPSVREVVTAPIVTRTAGYGRGQVDPRLAAAAGLDPNALLVNMKALGAQALATAPATLAALGAAAVYPPAGYFLGGVETIGEGARSVEDTINELSATGELQQSPMYQSMLEQTGGDEAAARAAVARQIMDRATPTLGVMGGVSTALARNIIGVGGAAGRALGVPTSRLGAGLAGGAVEAGTEALEEGLAEKMAYAIPGQQLTGLNMYPSLESMYGEGLVGALVGGGAALGSGVAQATGPRSTIAPAAPLPPGPGPAFTPAPPPPGFTPRPGPAATMTVEGTAADITPRPSPVAGQPPALTPPFVQFVPPLPAPPTVPPSPGARPVAQTPPGLRTAYQQAADTMREAGIRNIGGAPATMMDVAAATEIINNEIAEKGELSPQTIINLERATGLNMLTIGEIAAAAPRVRPQRDTLLTDVVTGTGGGGQIQVTANRDGTYTLKNLTTNDPFHIATVEPGQSLDEAIKIFDEVTTVGSPEAITVDTAGTATLPPSVTQPAVTPAAEPSTAIVPSTQTDALTGVGSLTTVGAGTQLGTAEPVDLTADSQTTSEILEFTPTEDFIEGTAVEIAGQIPGTVATETTPTTTTITDVPTTTTTGVFTFDEDFEPPPEEPAAEEELDAGAEEPDTEVTIQEAVDEAEEEEEAPFECPDGYTAVKLAGRWVCQKTETSTVGRPTVGTRPYLSKVGFAGPSPYPPSTRTVTRTVTAAE